MIVAGFGCRTVTTSAALHAALEAARRALPGGMAVGALAAPADRRAQLVPLAHALALPLLSVGAAEVRGQTTKTISSRCLAVRGCGSVAEAVALAAAGAGGRLLVTRHMSPDRTATCAIAQGENP